MHLTVEERQRWRCRQNLCRLPNIKSPKLFHIMFVLGLVVLQQTQTHAAHQQTKTNPTARRFSDTELIQEGDGQNDGNFGNGGKFVRFIEDDGVWKELVVGGNEAKILALEERNLIMNQPQDSKSKPQEMGESVQGDGHGKRAVSKRSTHVGSEAWRIAGLESDSLTLDRYDNGLNDRSSRRGPNSRNTNCPEDCKCGLVTGVTCYSPSNNALLPESFPRGIQLLTLYGYKKIANELEELLELTELSIYDGNLDEIPPLPRSLTHLRITNSNLKSLDKSNSLPYLQSLNAAHNNLTEANLSELSHLLSLDLSNNPIEKVPDLPSSLTILNLKNTHLNKQPTDWDVNLPSLRQLILSGIKIQQPPFLTLPKLEFLDLSHSELRLLPYLSALPNLKDINLSRLKVYEATPNHFRGPENLQKVDLSYTLLTKLPDKLFIHNPNLKEIYMHNTDIQYIKDYTLSGLSKLEKLIIRDNADLKNVDDKALSTLTNLKVLDLSYTPVRALPISLQNVNLTHLHAKNLTLLCDCHSHWVPAFFESIGQKTEMTGVFPVRCADGERRSLAELKAFILNQECTAPDIISPPDVTLRRGVGKTALLECNATGIPYPIIIWHSPDKKYYAYNHTDVQPWFSDKFKYIINHILPPESTTESMDTTTTSSSTSTTDPMDTTFPSTMSSAELTIDPRIRPLKTGQLLIQNMSRADVGLYRCIAVNSVASVTSTTSLWLTVAELEAFKIETLLFGLACAMTFLLTTLIVQLVRYIMDRMGWECCCCRGRLSSKAQQVKRLLESVESYKSQQLDKLKDNYNCQVVSIKDSCYQQMERLSDSYSQQCRNLQSIKDYSAQQLNTARDQYVEQINKVRDYSVGQMNKVGENYVFQRQRIRKFSAHQLFKLRETYKYQQKTLNKILENIPDLYLQNCRTGGNCNRTDSIIFDDEIHGIDAYYRLDFLDPILCGNEGSEDCYYTPSSTLTRTQRQNFIQHHRRQHSGCSTATSNECYQEAIQSWATNTPNLSPGNSPSHPLGAAGILLPNKLSLKHTRSMSICAVKPNNKPGYVPSHRRTLSANVNTVNPSSTPPALARVHHSRTTPPSPLVEKTYYTPMARSPTTDEEADIVGLGLPTTENEVGVVPPSAASLGYGSSGYDTTGGAPTTKKERSDGDCSDNESAAMLKNQGVLQPVKGAKRDDVQLLHGGLPRPSSSKNSSYIKLTPKPADSGKRSTADSVVRERRKEDAKLNLGSPKLQKKKAGKSSSDKSVVPVEPKSGRVGDFTSVAMENRIPSVNSSDENIHSRKDETIQAIEEKSAWCINELVKKTDALVSSANTRDDSARHSLGGSPTSAEEDKANGSEVKDISNQQPQTPLRVNNSSVENVGSVRSSGASTSNSGVIAGNLPIAGDSVSRSNTVPSTVPASDNLPIAGDAAPRTSNVPASDAAAKEAIRRKTLSREGSREMEGRYALPSVTEDKEPSSSSESNL